MKSEQALDWLTDHFGIVSSYFDLAGTEQTTSQETKLALLRANGLDLATGAEIKQAAIHFQSELECRRFPEELILNDNEKLTLAVPENTHWHIQLETDEDGDTTNHSKGNIDVGNLPIGLHLLQIGEGRNAEEIRIIVAPQAAPCMAEIAQRPHIWGINAALYGLHSDHRPGMGNFRHLAKTAEICGQQGASFLGINPVHAIGWNSPEIISPYSPTHRGYLNGLHIAAEMVEPQSQTSEKLISNWCLDYQDETDPKRVDYAQHAQHLRPLLAALYRDFQARAKPQQRQEFFKFCNRRSLSLARFAQFEHLSQLHGTEWSDWPEIGQEVEIIHANSNPDIAFHAWIQWIADQQLAKAHKAGLTSGMALGLYLDLAVGARRNGAEAWCEKSSIAEGVSVGAPPDHLSPAGQNWNLAAFAPKKLAGNNYQAFRDILDQTMRHCGIIRIDHVLGLNRSYWIPDDGSAGGYIKQNFEALMAMVRIGAQRNNTVVVGEDLGLVPDGFRDNMNQRNIYSYGVLQYEKDSQGQFPPPEKFKPKSLVCFGTHDTPTLAGYMKADDIAWWQRMNWIDDKQAKQSKADRRHDVRQLLSLGEARQTPAKQQFNQLRETVYDVLARSSAAMVSVQLDDLFGTIEAQNLPGTIDEHPNWQRKYAISVEHLESEPQLAEISQIMARKDRSHSPVAERAE